MTKLEYLKLLEADLQKRLSQYETDEIIRDYAEYFAEGASQGKTEEEMINNLGDPAVVAAQLIEETLSTREEVPAAPVPTPKKGRSPWVTVLLVLLGICLLPVALMVAGGLLFAAAVVIGCGIFLVGMAVTGVLLGILGLGAIFMYIAVLPPAAIAACITGCIAIVAAGVLVFCLSLQVVKLIWKLLCWCWAKLYTAITKKPWPAPVSQPEVQPNLPQSFEAEEGENNA